MSQLRDLLVGQKLSKVSRTFDMPILWLGDVEKARDNLIPDSVRTIADCEIHVQCPFTLKHAGAPVIGSYDVYLDESGKHVDPDHPDVKTIYDSRAEEIPALELMVQDISFHPVLGMTMHFQDQYFLTINHDSRLLTDFWCLRAKDQEFVFVNDELGSLQDMLNSIPDILDIGARAAILTYHSLEDRIVKHSFKELNGLKTVNKKVIVSTDEEIKINPRSRSAKLRIAEKAL